MPETPQLKEQEILKKLEDANYFGLKSNLDRTQVVQRIAREFGESPNWVKNVAVNNYGKDGRKIADDKILELLGLGGHVISRIRHQELNPVLGPNGETLLHLRQAAIEAVLQPELGHVGQCLGCGRPFSRLWGGAIERRLKQHLVHRLEGILWLGGEHRDECRLQV